MIHVRCKRRLYDGNQKCAPEFYEIFYRHDDTEFFGHTVRTQLNFVWRTEAVTAIFVQSYQLIFCLASYPTILLVLTFPEKNKKKFLNFRSDIQILEMNFQSTIKSSAIKKYLKLNIIQAL